MSVRPNEPPPPFAFSEETEREFQQILSRYPNAQAMVLPALHLAQKESGYLSESAMEYIAQRLGLPPSKVLGTATFYEMFHCYPVGRHHIQVCTGPSCALLGADRILEHLQHRLGIKPGQSTPDRRFTLAPTECLASCGTAPAIACNGCYHENMTTERIEELLQQWSQESQPPSEESSPEWTES